MEWIFLLAGLSWLWKLFNNSSSDDEELDLCKDEEEFVTVEIKKDPNTISTITRVSGANLKNKLINRPTVMRKRK